jgi:hypothetical protein
MARFSRYLKGFAHEMSPKSGWVHKSNIRNFDNLYTGYEFGGKAKITAAVAGLGFAGYQYLNSNGFNGELNRMTAESEDVNAMPGTLGDAQGYQAYPYLSKNQLAEQGYAPKGDLVFALHKLRHGGQLVWPQ